MVERKGYFFKKGMKNNKKKELSVWLGLAQQISPFSALSGSPYFLW
jgi:hypothetical protein